MRLPQTNRKMKEPRKRRLLPIIIMQLAFVLSFMLPFNIVKTDSSHQYFDPIYTNSTSLINGKEIEILLFFVYGEPSSQWMSLRWTLRPIIIVFVVREFVCVYICVYVKCVI